MATTKVLSTYPTVNPGLNDLITGIQGGAVVLFPLPQVGLSRWQIVSAALTAESRVPYLAIAAIDFSLPATLNIGDEFLFHAQVTGTRVLSGTYVIRTIGAGNNILMSAGDTARLVAYSATELEIV